MLRSHSIIFNDFNSEWYENWAKKLKQIPEGKGKFALRANKFWQNAVMAQILFERGALKQGNEGIGFGVGKERLPSLFASMGIKVSATDQDFTRTSAEQWDNDQLAQGAFSLNEDKICAPDKFNKNVSFMPLDMNKIPLKTRSKYDFLWSNCALGHLGSIEKGLDFIEASLLCLKPGGWAVHTTEVNIVSDEETVTDGNTVIFRLKDIYDLSLSLTSKGYTCQPFHLLSSRARHDQRVELDPVWGTDCTKIFVDGHIATQVVLVIHSPFSTPSYARQAVERLKHYIAYRKNLATLKRINQTNPTLKLLSHTRLASLEGYNLKPVKDRVKIDKDIVDRVVLEYINNSDFPLTGIRSLYDVKPLVLGTDSPVNHASKLANENWFTPNRPAVELSQKKGSAWHTVDYVKPGERFAFTISINPIAHHSGHTEDFSIIQEGGGIVPNTKVNIEFS